MVFAAGRKSDAALAFFVVAVACMLLVPLPTPLLDLLLVINLSFSILVLLVALYMQSALSLLAFPTILLLSTLFRLGLNVASTRLILSQGEAGEVINAFGNFLIRGEVVVGIIIFTIVTIVNFIVIAKGAARVSEVAARFSLDALPGKQMAIDSDLRAGLLTAQEAQRKREDLRKESQLYGSMDGAMKFVQGDAIAGVFIIITNICGGLYLGISRGQSLVDAMRTFTILTIGDGLVSQIPALLTSICAGIVVTRVASNESTTLGGDLHTQLFAQPRTLAVTAVLISVVGLLPGLPVIPFLVVACSLLFLAYMTRSGASSSGRSSIQKREAIGSSSLPALYAPLDDDSFDKDPVIIRLDISGLFALHKNQANKYRTFWSELAQDTYAQWGAVLPSYTIQSSDSLKVLSSEVILSETTIESLGAEADSVVVEISPDSAHAFGLEVLSETTHPIDGTRVSWCVQTPLLRALVESEAIRAYDPIEFTFLRVAGQVPLNPEFFLSSAEVHANLKAIDKRHPGFLAESLNREFLSTTRITEICHALLREYISVRDMRQIVEILSAYCSSAGKEYVEDGVYDLEHIVHFIRRARKKSIVGARISRQGSIRVVTIAEELEAQFIELATAPSRRYSSLQGAETSLQTIIGPIQKRGVFPICLLCQPDTRSKIAQFVSQLYPTISVFAFDELDPKVSLQYVGQWSL